MGSSWRYRHVAITPYSIGGFHGLARTFFTGSHLALLDKPANSLEGEKLWALIKVNRKTNRPNRPAPPFISKFQVLVSNCDLNFGAKN